MSVPPASAMSWLAVSTRFSGGAVESFGPPGAKRACAIKMAMPSSRSVEHANAAIAPSRRGAAAFADAPALSRGLQAPECVAARHLARLQAGHERLRALCRRAVRERVRNHVALAAALQAIVSDGGRCLHGRLDVAGLDQPPLLLRVVRPDPGKAVGLQLDPHLELIGVGLVHGALHRLHPRQNAEQVLHVMTDLVRDHVGLRELAALAPDLAAAETPLEILKERGVEIDLMVDRTVERPHGGLGGPAGRARGAGEHDQGRRLVGFPRLREYLFPFRLGASQHGGHELAHLVGGRLRLRTLRGGLRLLLRAAAQLGQDLCPADQVERIDAQGPADETEHEERADADAPGATGAKAARSTLALILDVVAAWQLIPAHVSSLPRLAQSLHSPGAVLHASCRFGRSCRRWRSMAAPMICQLG